MRKQNYKGRYEKRSLSKCRGICKTYDAIQRSYTDMLQADDSIKEFQCNVLLEELDIGEYTSDFVCTLQSNDIIVRECVLRDHLTKPMTARLLDISRNYWMNRGIADWGVVIHAEE